jgi:hypothetical protein
MLTASSPLNLKTGHIKGDPAQGSQTIRRRNGILEQQVAKRMNGFLHTALEQIESGE